MAQTRPLPRAQVRHRRRPSRVSASGRPGLGSPARTALGLLMPRLGLSYGEVGERSAKRDGSRWRARCRIGNGTPRTTQVTAIGPTRTGAIEALDERVREVQAALVAAAKAQGPHAGLTGKSTLGEVLDEWWPRFQKRDRAAGTLQEYASVTRLHVRPHFGDLQISECTVPEIDSRLHAFEEGTGKSSRQLRVVLGHVLVFAVRQGLLPSNPMRDVEPTSRTRSRSRLSPETTSPRSLDSSPGTSRRMVVGRAPPCGTSS